MDEQQHAKAFNNGYILAQHMPSLIEAIRTSPDVSNERLQVTLSGAKQYEREIAKGKLIEPDMSKQPEKDFKNPDIEMDREHD